MNALLTTALLAGAVTAAHDKPTRIEARATSICGQWDSVATGVYTVYQDLWNEDAGTGSQCTTVDTLTDDVLSWSTSWSWTGESSQVKSYANTVTNFTITTLASISSIPSLWSWSYSGTDIVADVSYDMFTSSSADGSDEYEIMVWLDAIGGAGPISSTGSTVATPEIAGTTWDLYTGPNGDTTVYSFVATSAVEDFDGDLMDFLNYLIENEGVSSSQYLLSIGAGTEPFTGTSAVLSVSSYSCGVSTGGSAAATTAVASASAVATSVEASATAVASSSAESSIAISSAAVSSAVAPASSATQSVAAPSAAAPSSSAVVQQASSAAQALTTAAPTTAAATSAEAATTLATTTKKSCHKGSK